MQAFGGVQESYPSHTSEQSVEEDDFGDFEDADSPNNTSGNKAVPRKPLGVQSPVPDPGSTYRKECTEPTEQPQDPSNRGIGLSSNDDNDWGDFTGSTVLFDTEKMTTIDDSHDQQDHANQLQPIESSSNKPLKVSLFPIASQVTTTRESIAARREPSNPYDFDQAEDWAPMVVQDPLLPASTSTLTAPTANAHKKKTSGPIVQTRNMGPPPSNIPPPSVLLSLFTKVFDSLPRGLRTVINPNNASSEKLEPLDQPQIDQIKAALSATRAAARIVAGRKLRWKRDTLLAQSMKIGPAGKCGGMKLTGVDKSENHREDQEAVEGLSVWRKQVGPLRSIMSTLNARLPGNALSLPELSEIMPIRVVKPSEGAVTAPKCCFLCGIKRDERVSKVDVNVEDSFDEFWAEHWGHIDCVLFWKNYEKLLPHR